jgi:hypothetical protein
MWKPTILLGLFGVSATASADSTIPNPKIDMNAYLKVASEAAAYRESHRISEADFIRMSRERGTIVLDARSREKFDMLHVRGALNLSFPDIDVPSLARLLPDRNARILIYCNNNFADEPAAFPAKAPSASLNLSTFIALFTYGYRNVWELGPLLDTKNTHIPLEGTRR